LVRVTTA
jgi:hypothetical protein